MNAPSPCACPTCRVSRGITAARAAAAEIDLATDEWINRSTEMEGNLYWLIDEVRAVAGSRGVSVQARERLRSALRMVGA